MKYFFLCAIFLFFIGLPLAFFFGSRHLFARRHYNKKILSALAAAGTKYQATPYLRQIIKILHAAGKADILSALGKAQTASAIRFFKAADKDFYAAVLEGYTDLAEAANLFEAILRRQAEDKVLAELCKIYYLQGKAGRCRLALSKISPKAKGYVKALRQYFEMIFFAQEGDLRQAADSGASAEKLFSACDAWEEDAGCLLFLGTVYRVSSLFDAAYIMFKSALSLAERLQNPSLKTEVLGNLGMLMMTENRFTDSFSYLQEAVRHAKSHGQENFLAELNNQKALLKILGGNLLAASRYAKIAQKRHQRLQNQIGQAMSSELLSYIAKAKGDYAQMVKQAQEAEILYQNSGNLSAYFESMYLQAEGYYLQGLDAASADTFFAKAEEKLRFLTSKTVKTSGCFHPSNAYTLLGLIYLYRKDYHRAKALFNKSLSLEQKDERLVGIATDFANIGLSEKLIGNQELARKNIELALEYAAADTESDLYRHLQQMLQEFKN